MKQNDRSTPAVRFIVDNTLIGDAVNLTQRLESNCTPGHIMMSREAFNSVTPELKADLVTRDCKITVKGKKAEIKVVEISVS